MQAELDAQDQAEYSTVSKKMTMQSTACKHDMQELLRHAATVPCREQQQGHAESNN